MVVLKTSKELSDMKLSCKISAQALRLAGELIKPGVSTAYVDKMLHEFILSQGARPTFLGYGGFPASACISINNEVIHGIPSEERIIQDGDIVSVDVGAAINGYTGDRPHLGGSAEDHGRHKGMPLQGDPGGAAWQQAGRHRARGAVLRRKLRLCGGQRLCGTWRRQETARRPSSP